MSYAESEFNLFPPGNTVQILTENQNVVGYCKNKLKRVIKLTPSPPLHQSPYQESHYHEENYDDYNRNNYSYIMKH